jgi:SAM-dependent methyltransferase
MHPAALSYVRRFKTNRPLRVLDIGGRDVNGTPRALFPHAEYTVIDLLPGSNVDLVGDVLETDLGLAHFDLILCLEVFEHTERWRQILWAARRLVRPQGRLVVTCATYPRRSHSGVDGGPILHRDEWYENIGPLDLMHQLLEYGWSEPSVEVAGADLRATAVRARVDPL